MTQFFRKISALATLRPQSLFWSFIALHLILWTLLPTVSNPSAPLDVIEGYLWGREWLMGTYKHPPMQAWCLEILGILTGRASWAYYLASQIAVVAAFWAVWDTGRRMVSETQALVGVLLLEGVIYYNFTSPEFNPNVLQLAFWALAARSFHRAVRENKITDWLLLGVWGAGGMYSKYSTVLLLAVFGILIITRPEARRCLKKPGPYLAVLVTALLFLPHVVWLFQHDFMPFTYVKERLEAVGPATRYLKNPPAFFPTFLLSPLVFIVGQILAVVPAALLFLVLDDHEHADHANTVELRKFDQPFLAAITFAPMLVTLAMSICLGFKIHDMWGAPFFNFVGLWAVTKYYPDGVRIKPRFVVAWALVFLAGVLGYSGSILLSPYTTNKPMRVHFPGKNLAQQITEEWHKRYNAPLDYVIGDTWPAGNVAFYSPDRPHVYIHGDAKISTWIDPVDVRKKGSVLVWLENHYTMQAQEREAALHKEFPTAEMQPMLSIPQKTGADLPPVLIGWAILPPS